jgi:hypothetical protein
MADTNKPTEKMRAAEPRYYWFHVFNGPVEFYWDDWEVSEDEYRRNARPEDVAYLDRVVATKSE